MIFSHKLLVINLGGSADLGFMRISMVHANHRTESGALPANVSFNKQAMSGANSAGKSGSSSSSSSSALSFSGGAAAGWVIKIANEGPTIYHTGDTNVFADMGLIDELYKPTHVLMPMGEQCTMGACDAAYACKEFLTNCQTFIPMHFKTTNANELQN